MLKVYYIYHSCFLVEIDKRYLLFDYFDKSVVADTVSYQGGLPQLDTGKKLYVFASHSHKDHFTLEVLRWIETNPDITYVLSKDIRLGFNYLKRNGIASDIKKHITFVSPGNKYELEEDLTVETLRSNDAGVAYFITVEGIKIYHAGDLNWWNVEGRGELYGEQYGREYRRELRHIENKKIDLAFVVLDPRMGEDGYFLGAEEFIKSVEADYIFPMHLWGQYEWIERFKNRPSIVPYKERIIDIDQENMIFELSRIIPNLYGWGFFSIWDFCIS